MKKSLEPVVYWHRAKQVLCGSLDGRWGLKGRTDACINTCTAEAFAVLQKQKPQHY